MLLFQIVFDKSFSTFCIEIIQILYDSRFGKSDRDRVHCVVSVVIPFGPVLDSAQLLFMSVFFIISHPGSLIFWPVEFLEHINQPPVFTKPRSEERRVGKW